MRKRHLKIKLIGSTQFKDTFFQIAKELTGKGFSVFNLKLFKDKEDRDIVTNMGQGFLHSIHCQEIEESDIIYVVNLNNYIGEGLKLELKYVEEFNKPIYWHEGKNSISLESGLIASMDEYQKFHTEIANLK